MQASQRSSAGGEACKPSSIRRLSAILGSTTIFSRTMSVREGKPINLYVAYYGSQRKGSSPHSPRVCIPGGGWEITDLQRNSYANPATGIKLSYNRAVIEKGSDKQIVYYWFSQRGRNIANEYVSKWYLLEDAVLQNRTDGALVRLTTPVGRSESEHEADERLQAFLPMWCRD